MQTREHNHETDIEQKCVYLPSSSDGAWRGRGQTKQVKAWAGRGGRRPQAE
jgi:hypothetical protein